MKAPKIFQKFNEIVLVSLIFINGGGGNYVYLQNLMNTVNELKMEFI